MSSCFHLLSFPPPPLRRLELFAMFHGLGSLSGTGSWLLNGCVWKCVLPANGNFDRENWWSTCGFCGTLGSDRPKWERFWTLGNGGNGWARAAVHSVNRTSAESSSKDPRGALRRRLWRFSIWGTTVTAVVTAVPKCSVSKYWKRK